MARPYGGADVTYTANATDANASWSSSAKPLLSFGDMWAFTLTEAWAWGRPAPALVDRTASPWDDPARRPSHADKRRAWRRALLGEEIRAALRPGVTEAEIQAAAERLLNLAA